MSALDAARDARLATILDRRYRDTLSGATYTIRERLAAGAYAYRTRHVEDGKRDTYGLILAAEIDGELDYMTPVVPVAKMVHDYAAGLPVVEVDETRGTLTRDITDAEWAHLTGEASSPVDTVHSRAHARREAADHA